MIMCNNLLKGRKTCGGIPIIALDFVDEAAIMEHRGRFGGSVMSLTRNTDVLPGKSGSLM